eukprot:2766189-Rhodomonas_salina.2
MPGPDMGHAASRARKSTARAPPALGLTRSGSRNSYVLSRPSLFSMSTACVSTSLNLHATPHFPPQTRLLILRCMACWRGGC